MNTAGLVSVTFRKKSPEEICALCQKAGLRAIEWGGDIHVPAGDIERARYVRELSRRYGIEICAYGSYFRVGDDEAGFEQCVETALELGAPLIRVWLGRASSADADEALRARYVESLRSICKIAADKGIIVAPEFHGGTLTDDPKSVKRLLEETADIENLRFYWQPRWDWDEETRLDTLKMVLPRLAHVHVFTWEHTPDVVRKPLADGVEMWKKAIGIAGNAHMLMEFVEDDSDDALVRDANTLNEWINV